MAGVWVVGDELGKWVGSAVGSGVGGGLTLGAVDDDACPAGAAGPGTLRFHAEKGKMQICTAEGPS